MSPIEQKGSCMKKKGLAHAFYLLILLVFLTLFLSAFVWTCFHQREPSVEVTEIIIPVQAPPLFEKPVEVEVSEKVVIPSMPVFASEPLIERYVRFLPPPEHLLSFPLFPGLQWRDTLPTIIMEPVEIVAPIAVPHAPAFMKDPISKVFVPDIPYVFEPLVLTEEEYDMFYPQTTAFTGPTDDDFWADFFVVGADTAIAFEDGFYFLSLFINDERVGDIEVEFSQENRFINTEELAFYIGRFITNEAYTRIFGDNKEYLSLDDLIERGVQASYDPIQFAVFLTFSLQDMPERTISITASAINRREQFGLSGAIVLKPAKFALATSLSLYAMLDYPSDFSQLDQRIISLAVSNRASLFGIGLNFFFSLSSRTPYFNPGSWSGFYDFVESSHRLSFGNIGSSLSNKNIGSSTNFAINFEKNYAYGTDRAKGNQFEYRIVLVEPSEVIISINDDDVFKRKFQAGTYRLRDFVFTQGANKIKITIIPDAHPDDVRVEYVDMGYDYRLLGRGDSLYGFGISVPQVKSASTEGTFSLPWVNNQYLSYHLDAFTASFYQQTGITDTFTMTTELAVSPGVFSGTLNSVLATMIGTSQLQLTLGLNEEKRTPSFSSSLSHRYSGPRDGNFGTLSTTINHSIPALSVNEPYKSNTTLSLSYAGKLTETIRYTLSGNVGYNSIDAYPTWGVSFSSGFSPFRGFSISGSVSLADQDTTKTFSPRLTAQLGGSYSFSPRLSASTSTSLISGASLLSGTATSSLGMSYRPTSNDSLSLSLSSFKYSDPLDHSLVAAWSRSGVYSSFSLRQQITRSYQKMATTFTANTSLAYADGAFGIGRSVNESFLLVKPVGELKRSQITVARSLDSAPTFLPRPLGSALYNNITTNTKNSVVVFSSGATDFSLGASFVYEITPRSRQSFVARIDVEPSFTVSGLLYMSDGSPYVQYSSPVYRVLVDENGEEELVRDDSLYLFTDQEGRYILSEVGYGTYLFDLQVEDLWYAVRFEVPNLSSEELGLDRVLLLEDFWVADPAFEQRIIILDAFTGFQVEEDIDVFGTELTIGYDAEVQLESTGRTDEESFWTLIFPPFDLSDFSFESFDDGFVTEEQFFFDETAFDEMIGIPVEDPAATQIFTAAP